MAAYENKRFEQNVNEQVNILGEVKDLQDNLEALTELVKKNRKHADQNEEKSIADNSLSENKKKKMCENIYKCQLCKQTFSRNFSLNRHNITYHSETSTKTPPKENKENKEKYAFECNKCDKSFGRKDLLKKHTSRKHVDPAHPKFDCKHCGKKFISPYNLQDHVLKCHSKPTATSNSTTTTTI